MVINFQKKYLLILLPLLVFSYWYFFPSPQRIIKRNLDTIAKQLSLPKAEHPLETIKRIRLASEHFANNVSITVSYEGKKEEKTFTKTEIQQKLLAGSAHAKPLNISTKDLSISASGKDFQANFTALVKHFSANQNTEITDAQEIESDWQELDGNWKLVAIRNVEALN